MAVHFAEWIEFTSLPRVSSGCLRETKVRRNTRGSHIKSLQLVFCLGSHLFVSGGSLRQNSFSVALHSWSGIGFGFVLAALGVDATVVCKLLRTSPAAKMSTAIALSA